MLTTEIKEVEFEKADNQLANTDIQRGSIDKVPPELEMRKWKNATFL